MSLSTALRTYAAGQQGAPRWFLGSLLWVKAGHQPGERLSLVEAIVPVGEAAPLHVHHTEDEVIYVIDGELTAVVAEQRVSLSPGGCAFGPRDVPHAFRIEGEQPARILLMTNSGDFASFQFEASEPATAPILPEPRPPDFERLAVLAAKHGSELLGPFPT